MERGRYTRGVSDRDCSKTSCSQPAVATLTFVYADSTAVIGPLSRESEPHSYDLCADHAANFTGPNGWDVVVAPRPLEPEDDVLALARALSEPDASPHSSRANFRRDQEKESPVHEAPPRHLSVVRSPRHD